MEVNADFIKKQRKIRGWTQQHLADACAVSLRTIQRVEREGSAANETAHALCAVFEIERAQLSIIPRVDESQLQTVKLRGQVIFVVLALIGGILLGAGSTYLLLVYR
jgi:transcriptional regulator with XRE-family HTH domain